MQKEEEEEGQREEGEEEGEERPGEERWRGIRGSLKERKDFLFILLERQGVRQGEWVWDILKERTKNKEKKRICVGNGVKIKLGGRGRGGEGAEKGREKECAPGWQLSMMDEGTCFTREKKLEREIKGGGKKAAKFYFFCYVSHSTVARFLCLWYYLLLT